MAAMTARLSGGITAKAKILLRECTQSTPGDNMLGEKNDTGGVIVYWKGYAAGSGAVLCGVRQCPPVGACARTAVATLQEGHNRMYGSLLCTL